MLDSVPADWRVMRFSEVITEIYGGGTPDKTNADYWDGGIYWASVKDLVSFNPTSTQERISAEGLKNSSAKIVKSGTLIFCTRMAVGVARVYDVDVAINQDLKAIVPNNLCSRDFLFYWFENQKKSIEGLATGTTVKGVRQSMLLNMEIILPPLSEQQRIAEILTSVDDSIRATETVIAQAERVKRGLMEDLLTGGLGSAAIARGEVPEGWHFGSFGELAKVKNGFAFKSKDFTEDELRSALVVRMSNFNNGLVDYSCCKRIPFDVVEGLERFELHDGDILIAMSGATVGKLGLVKDPVERVFLNQRVGCLAPKNGTSNSFLWQLMSMELFSSKVVQAATGNAQPNISTGQIEKISTIVPPPDVQKKIADTLSAFDDDLANNKACVLQLQRLKRGLMDDLLTGRVRTV